MKFDDKHSFRQPVEALTKMYFSRAYHERKYDMMKARNVEVLELVDEPDRFHIVVRFSTDADAPLPDFAKRVIGDSLAITQTDSWDRKALKGTINVEIKGAPVKVSADMVIRSEPSGGASNNFVWNVQCGIPLVGGKIEKIIAGDIQSKAGADAARSQKILDEQS